MAWSQGVDAYTAASLGRAQVGFINPYAAAYAPGLVNPFAPGLVPATALAPGSFAMAPAFAAAGVAPTAVAGVDGRLYASPPPMAQALNYYGAMGMAPASQVAMAGLTYAAPGSVVPAGMSAFAAVDGRLYASPSAGFYRPPAQAAVGADGRLYASPTMADSRLYASPTTVMTPAGPALVGLGGSVF
eukprot:Tamp_28897.p1 GENE.Tamp_28897~~Tamp_28897.p1  ORF type:complete len:187 (-),score=19.47 Tamp_28897:158-718(-)